MPIKKGFEFTDARHSEYIRSLWPECAGNKGGVDLPKLTKRGKDVEIKESHTKRRAINLSLRDLKYPFLLVYCHLSRYFYLLPMKYLVTEIEGPSGIRSVTEYKISRCCMEHFGQCAATMNETEMQVRVEGVRKKGKIPPL